MLGMLETLSTILAANARYARLNGREHLVAPMTLIVPGVLAGSMGPLLYPPDEVSKNPQVWNEVPMVLYHPQDETGKHISAKTPGVIDKHGLGVVKRSIWNGKHVAEGWFDLAKLDAVDNRLEAEGKPKLRPRLERGEKIELSTGLFTENEEKAGEFNGQPYTHIARNYRPDHLAILPDQPGACSVNDGCGVNNELVDNQERHIDTGHFLNKTGASAKQIQRHAEKGFGVKAAIKDSVADEKEGIEKYKQYADMARKANMPEMAAEWERIGSQEKDHLQSFEEDAATYNAGTDIKQIATNQGVNIMGLSTGERAGIINAITANCGCNDEDKKVLNGMSDAGLLRLKANAFPKKGGGDDSEMEEDSETKERNDGYKGKPDSSNADQTGGGMGRVEGEDNKGIPPEKKVNNRRQPKLAPEDEEALAFARNQRDGAKRQLASQIVANIADEKQQIAVYNRLMKLPIEELQFQASYFPKAPAPVQRRESPPPSFLGNAGGPDGRGAPTVNHTDPDLLLDEPTVNYAEWSQENRAINGGHGKKFTGTQVA